jgi:hypothetical protein
MRAMAARTEMKERSLLGPDEDEAPAAVVHDEEGHKDAEPLFEGPGVGQEQAQGEGVEGVEGVEGAGEVEAGPV